MITAHFCKTALFNTAKTNTTHTHYITNIIKLYVSTLKQDVHRLLNDVVYFLKNTKILNGKLQLTEDTFQMMWKYSTEINERHQDL